MRFAFEGCGYRIGCRVGYTMGYGMRWCVVHVRGESRSRRVRGVRLGERGSAFRDMGAGIWCRGVEKLVGGGGAFDGWGRSGCPYTGG